MFDTYGSIDLFGPFYGANWHAAEMVDGLTYRWSGPQQTSSIRAPTLGARDLRVRWTFAFAPQEEQLKGLIWSVDGKEGPLNWTLRSGYAVLWGDFQVASKESFVIVTLTVPDRDKEPHKPVDPRTLGLAVHKLEVFALDGATIGQQAFELRRELAELAVKLDLAEEQLVRAKMEAADHNTRSEALCAHLHEEIDARDRSINDLLNSTSWMVSRPLRWLMSSLHRPVHNTKSASFGQTPVQHEHSAHLGG